MPEPGLVEAPAFTQREMAMRTTRILRSILAAASLAALTALSFATAVLGASNGGSWPN